MFAEIGWTVLSAWRKTFGATGTLLRETKSGRCSDLRLRTALERLNPALPVEAIAPQSMPYTRPVGDESRCREPRRLGLYEVASQSSCGSGNGGLKTERRGVIDWTIRRRTTFCS